jgi:hypothetical protein
MGTCTAVNRETARTLMATRTSCQDFKIRMMPNHLWNSRFYLKRFKEDNMRSPAHQYRLLRRRRRANEFTTSEHDCVAQNRHRGRVHCSTLSHESETCNRSPAISSTAFDTRPPDLPPASLMDTDFAISCPLVRRRRPQIQFLSIGPYLCSTLPSDPTSR